MPEAESEGKIQGFNIDIQGKEINGANPDVQKAIHDDTESSLLGR